MKKVFLSLAVIAALTVVSCKNASENTEAVADSAAAVVDSAATEAVETVDSAAAAVDTAATEAVEAVKEEVKK